MLELTPLNKLGWPEPQQMWRPEHMPQLLQGPTTDQGKQGQECVWNHVWPSRWWNYPRLQWHCRAPRCGNCGRCYHNKSLLYRILQECGRQSAIQRLCPLSTISTAQRGASTQECSHGNEWTRASSWRDNHSTNSCIHCNSQAWWHGTRGRQGADDDAQTLDCSVKLSNDSIHLKPCLCKFGIKGIEVAVSELTQLHVMDTWKVMDPFQLSREAKAKVYLHYYSSKRWEVERSKDGRA